MIITIITITENAANYVKGVLNYYVDNFVGNHITQGIHCLKRELQESKIDLRDDYLLASIDVVNMFTNVSTDKAQNIIRKLVADDINFEARNGMEKEDFLALVDIILLNSYFVYEGEFYRQKHGLPMGSSVSPVVADLVMLDLEVEMLKMESAKDLLFYRRFKDDSFLIWKGCKGTLLEFLEDINNLDENGRLKFTVELGDSEGIAFLDAKIKIKNQCIEFRVFSKPYSAGVLMNFKSHQDIGVKKSIIAGEVIRYHRISDNFEEDLQDLRVKLRNNDYPDRIVEEVIQGTSKKLKKGKKEKEKDCTKWLSICYPGRKRAKALRKISRKYGFKLAFKKNKTLANIFSKSYKYNTNNNKGIIYSITCKCGAEYIGETGKDLCHRIKQHKYAIKVIDYNNGIAVHCQECTAGIRWEEAEILGKEGKWYHRKMKESLWIQKNKPTMNLNDGINLRGKWN